MPALVAVGMICCLSVDTRFLFVAGVFVFPFHLHKISGPQWGRTQRISTRSCCWPRS